MLFLLLDETKVSSWRERVKLLCSGAAPAKKQYMSVKCSEGAGMLRVVMLLMTLLLIFCCCLLAVEVDSMGEDVRIRVSSEE